MIPLTEPRRARAAVDYYAARSTAGADRGIPAGPIAAPTLCVHVTDEPSVRREAFARALPALGPGSRVVALDGVGHWPHLERPDEVNRLLLDGFGGGPIT